MAPGLGAHLLIGIVAALTTWASVPLAGRLSLRLGAVAQPDARRVHVLPTPTLGGAAMLAGTLVALGVAALTGAFSSVIGSGNEVLGITVAATVIYLVGLIDDVVEVSAPAKTAGMVLAGSILTLAGVSIVFFRFPFLGFTVLSSDLAAPVTVLWVLGMANAVNLVDGLDGLAAGIVGIAAAALFIYTRQLGGEDLIRAGNPAPLIAIIVAGVCVGFLPHNFHPARIFMGDGGALLLGLLMAAATISVGGQSRAEFSGQAYFFFAPLVIPLVILGVPISDTLFAIIRRARARSGMSTADKGHLHHRLMDLGHGQRRSVLILWAWTALLSGVVLYPTFTGRGDTAVVFGVAAMALLLFTYFHPGIRGRKKDPENDASGGPALGDDSGHGLEQDGDVRQ